MGTLALHARRNDAVANGVPREQIESPEEDRELQRVDQERRPRRQVDQWQRQQERDHRRQRQRKHPVGARGAREQTIDLARRSRFGLPDGIDDARAISVGEDHHQLPEEPPPPNEPPPPENPPPPLKPPPE